MVKRFKNQINSPMFDKTHTQGAKNLIKKNWVKKSNVW